MRVGVIGAGYVGLVTAIGLASSGHRVTVAEQDAEKLEALQRGKVPFYEPGLQDWLEALGERLTFTASARDLGFQDVVIVAVGTPSIPFGQTDLSQVKNAIKDIVETAAPDTVIVMKSTVPPGTGRELIRTYLDTSGRRMLYASNPEFLRQGQAMQDWFHPHRVVIGADDREAAERVASLYSGIQAPIIFTDITSAEMIKYAANALLATKISFINEVANLCELVGANIDDVVHGVGLDPRLGPHFLQPGIGYGGSCFPKDTRALEFTATVNGYSFELLRAVIEVNRRQRIRVVHRLATILGRLEGKQLGLLGLTFKPGTDDTRESPGLEIAEMLAAHGATVRAYDPCARLPDTGLIRPKVIRVGSLLDAVDGSAAVIVATDWPEFRTADWAAIRSRMVTPYLVFDGRNCLDREAVTRAGLQYIGIGRRRMLPEETAFRS